MGTTNFSRHIVEDRIDRYVAIATKIGFGEILYTVNSTNRYGDTIMQLTSTGVIIVKTPDEKLITIYCGTIATVKKHFRLDCMPRDLFFTIRNNEKKGYCNL